MDDHAGEPPIETRTHRVRTLDGRSLGATSYALSRGAAERGLLVINSATGVRQQFYERFASYLAGRGLRVVTYDYRGIGASREGPVRRVEASMHDWGRHDFAAMLRWARTSHPELPLFALGHSVGGQLFGLTEETRHVAGLVGIAAQSGYWRHFPGATRMWFNWHVLIPAVARAWGHLPGWAGLGESLPRGVALEWARWGRSPAFFVDACGRPLETFFGEVTAPVLWIGIAGDPFAPRAAVDWIARRFERAAVDRRELTGAQFGTGPIGHFRLFKPLYRRAWQEIADWLLQRVDAHQAV